MAETNQVVAQLGGEGDAAIPFCGMVCCFTSCYTEIPECIGAAGKTSCLCYHSEFLSCKLPNPEKRPEDKDLWWVCSRGHAWLGPFNSICSERYQCFCYDVRGSLPPTEEIPCMVTLCFFTLFYKNKMVNQFFKSFKDLEDAAANAK